MKNYWMGALMTAVSLGVAAQDEATEATAESAPSAIAVWEQLGDRYYASPMLSYNLADGGRQTDDGYGTSLAVGRRIAEGLLVEAGIQHHWFGKEVGGGSAKLAGLGFNTLFFPAKGRSGYLSVGAGYGDVSSHPGGDANYGTLLLNAGGGYWWKPFDFILPGLSFRTEALWRLDAHNDRRTGETEGNGRKAFSDLVLNVGLVIPVGAVPVPPATPVEPVQVVAVVEGDSDGDGVVDGADQCPGTVAGTAVDASGCTATPAEEVAPAATCKTPATGEKLDLVGCGTGDVIVLKGVNFEFNKDRLTTNAKTILEGVSEAMKAQSSLHVEVGGHTDGKGTEDYNTALSQRRACAVGRYLSSHGVGESRMSPVGYGEAAPVADNESEEGREENRRVELKVIDGPGSGFGSCPGSAASARPSVPSADPVTASDPDSSVAALTKEPAAYDAPATSEPGVSPTEDAIEESPAVNEFAVQAIAASDPEPAVKSQPGPPPQAPGPTSASGVSQPVQMVSPDEVF